MVFYLPEQQFYFFDSRVHRYEPTTEQKLVFLLSRSLIQCAAEMPQDVEIAKLFIELRKEDNLRKVVRRAKALLAADESFFGESSPNKRLKGPESHSSVAKVFAREILASPYQVKPDHYGMLRNVQRVLPGQGSRSDQPSRVQVLDRGGDPGRVQLGPET